MLPTINGKSFTEINEDELKLLLDNQDYRENEYIDYKENFAFLEFDKNDNKRNEKIVEFKNDVCSFANSEGGYLIFGISEKNGIATNIVGINIPNNNTDSFEQERRNNLLSIFPKTPFIIFHFIKLENGKYVVVLFIQSDNFAPYLFLENQCRYYAYTRNGNRKFSMTYNELKNRFNQSIILEKEIYNFRLDRIKFCEDKTNINWDNGKKFLLIHLIPETFIDSSYNINPFALSIIKHIKFSDIFNHFNCGHTSLPSVDGLRFIASPESDYRNYEGLITYNGIVECLCPLNQGDLLRHASSGKDYFEWCPLWNQLGGLLESYKNIFSNRKIFVCLSLINCQNVFVNDNNYDVRLDRNLIITNPVVYNDIISDDEYEFMKKKLYVEFLLALGIHREPSLKESIKLLYSNQTIN